MWPSPRGVGGISPSQEAGDGCHCAFLSPGELGGDGEPDPVVRTAAAPAPAPRGSVLRLDPPADLESMQAAESDPVLCSSPGPGISHHW